jgi:hypothetical protein
MWNTRKAIIELIEPYMDKTLSEWCYIEPLYFIEKQELARVLDVIIEYDRYWDEYKYIKIDRKIQWEDRIVYEDKNIIGHYDITAVLKFIKSCWYTSLSWYIDMDIIQFLYIFLTEIPNKPLHLYTEKEDEELLDLLIKLK